MMVELSLHPTHVIRTRYLSIKMTRGLWSLRPVMYLSRQIIATSAEVTPNGGLGSGKPPEIPWTPLNSSLGITGKLHSFFWLSFVIGLFFRHLWCDPIITRSAWRLKTPLLASHLFTLQQGWPGMGCCFLGKVEVSQTWGWQHVSCLNGGEKMKGFCGFWFGLRFTWPENPLHSPRSGPGFGQLIQSFLSTVRL